MTNLKINATKKEIAETIVGAILWCVESDEALWDKAAERGPFAQGHGVGVQRTVYVTRDGELDTYSTVMHAPSDHLIDLDTVTTDSIGPFKLDLNWTEEGELTEDDYNALVETWEKEFVQDLIDAAEDAYAEEMEMYA